MSKKIEIYNMEHLAELSRESTISFRNEVFLDHKRGDKFLCFEESQGFNIMPTEGLNAILDTAIRGTTQIASWYVGLFKGNVTPLSTHTAATALGAAGALTECTGTDYDETVRQTYTAAAASGGVITNVANKATFTIGATINPVYGAFICSSNTKGGTTGVLLAAKKFDAARSVVDSDVLYITYQITAVSA